MADKNAKIWLFPRVLAPSVFQIARSTFLNDIYFHLMIGVGRKKAPHERGCNNKLEVLFKNLGCCLFFSERNHQTIALTHLLTFRCWHL